MSKRMLKNRCRPIPLFGWQEVLQEMRMLFYYGKDVLRMLWNAARASPHYGRVYREKVRAKKNELIENVLVRK